MRFGVIALMAALGLAPLHPAGAVQSYEILFREGVLDTLAPSTELAYSVARTGRSAPERPDEVPLAGVPQRLFLTFLPEGEVELTAEDGAHRQQAGRYPASVGNPLIMYFLETVLRDMASQSGGSPFYIRNRIKESMLGEAEMRPVTLTLEGGREIAGQELVIHPFAKDKARDRMAGFADLTLTAQVSDAAPGWYVSLSASAPAAAGSDAPGYSNAIRLTSGAGP